jgi:hypothetical protein
MSLNAWAVLVMGGYVVMVVFAALVMTLRPGQGADLVYADARAEDVTGDPTLRQASGVMPARAWGFKPPVGHSHYRPAPWHERVPDPDADSLTVVERATDIKRRLGSEHPPWERLDRQGL